MPSLIFTFPFQVRQTNQASSDISSPLKTYHKKHLDPRHALCCSPAPQPLTAMKKEFTPLSARPQTVMEKREEKGRNRNSLLFHSLRHSFNSAMANAGVSQEVRQGLTGHASKAVNPLHAHGTRNVAEGRGSDSVTFVVLSARAGGAKQ